MNSRIMSVIALVTAAAFAVAGIVRGNPAYAVPCLVWVAAAWAAAPRRRRDAGVYRARDLERPRRRHVTPAPGFKGSAAVKPGEKFEVVGDVSEAETASLRALFGDYWADHYLVKSRGMVAGGDIAHAFLIRIGGDIAFAMGIGCALLDGGDWVYAD